MKCNEGCKTLTKSSDKKEMSVVFYACEDLLKTLIGFIKEIHRADFV